MTAPTVMDGLSPSPAARQAKPAPPTVPVPADVTRVLVVGPHETSGPGRVPWALTQLWRREGRPLVVFYRADGVGPWARRWALAHGFAGVLPCGAHAPGMAADVVLTFGPLVGLDAARPLLRQCGVEVVDGLTLEEFR